ncbi:MAG: hypothetical protein HFJ30_04515 [Clostridia bacterium]|jgi:energy-coupling factor transporter transmembrane protein EcfT|nr:hypothetical protein [Clostridia bacterium]
MKNIITFILFLLYATAIFFIPNNIFLLCPFVINMILWLITKSNMKKTITNLFKIAPFVLLTFLINCWLDTYINALWMAVKLLLVCNITFIYSQTTTTAQVAKTVKKLCTPLKVFKINPEIVEVLVAIALSILPIMRKEYIEVKEACKAKNIPINLKNSKIILSRMLTSYLKRVDEIDEALIEKGYNY